MNFLTESDLRSNFKFESNFHHLQAGNIEIGPRPLGIVMHEGKNAFSPPSHAGLAVGRNDGLVSGVVGNLDRARSEMVHIRIKRLAACMIRVAYLMEITTISDLKISDTIPMTASGAITAVGLAAFVAICNVWRGLVPISPKTTPVHKTMPPARLPKCLIGAPSAIFVVI